MAKDQFYYRRVAFENFAILGFVRLFFRLEKPTYTAGPATHHSTGKILSNSWILLARE
ncbi:MAG: hypothetical protein ACI8R4_003086 [Paracoccaceae bacterium]|jgi:hypothetical protein